MINVTKTYLPPIKEYYEYLKKIWQSGQVTNNGPIHKELEARLSEFLGVQNFRYVANGTLALQLAIKALGLTGQIITTPYSYVATTTAILWEGCEPVFVDIDEKTLCINPLKIEKAITNKTTAILATHVYGYPCDVDAIQDIADKYHLKVIYDAAHAFGVKIGDRSILSYGDISTLSFHATKIFHTVEGGAVVCRDPDVSKKVWLMSKFGHIGEDEYIGVGINAKNSELHAAMGLCILPHIGNIISARKQISVWYDDCLNNSGLGRPLLIDGLKYNYAYYPVLFKTHEQMMKVRTSLFEKEIIPRRYFYPSLNSLPFFVTELKRCCPVSESISERILCLPIYVGLEFNQITQISLIIKENSRE